MHIAGFANPWEHTRLLSDASRNRALITLLQRHAPGKTVLEVGCGTGLLSLVAAKLGARQVHAVEPTAMAEVARELVRCNGLEGIVQVHEAMIQDLTPRPVDLAFFELLNADPFVEGVMSVAEATRAWVGEHGLLAPRRLRVFAALCGCEAPAREMRQADDELRRLEASLGLRLGPLREALQTEETSKEIGVEVPMSAPVEVWSLDLRSDELPEDEEVIQLTAMVDAEVGGVMVWFEAELDDGLVLSNAPGTDNHWGQLLAGFSETVSLEAGASIEVVVELDDDELEVRRA
ncbi:MAG: SAM-dependent methyltransferase [Myxococcota bacterium]